MKSNLRFGVIMMIGALLLMGIIQAGKKTPINWNKTYNPNHTQPYGTYVFKHELKNLFQKKTKVTEIRETVYSYFSSNQIVPENQSFLYIGNTFSIGKEGNKQLFSFVKQGGTAFIAAEEFDQSFLDSLQLDNEVFSAYRAGQGFEEYDTYLGLYKTQQRVVYDKLETPKLFNELNPETTTMLGSLLIHSMVAPNFVRVRYGTGEFFVHLAPEVFTNYYLLKKEPFSLAAHSIQYLEGKSILWYDGLYNIDESRTPLRVILTKPALRTAWYILLVSLLFLLIFRSRREQRAIPILLPEENKSVEFAKTIGSVYYENGHPDDMIAKKIHYFLYDVRRHFRLDTNDLTNQKFIHSLSQRTQIDENELKDFINELLRVQQKKKCTVEDLKNTYHLIENFKQKARML